MVPMQKRTDDNIVLDTQSWKWPHDLERTTDATTANLIWRQPVSPFTGEGNRAAARRKHPRNHVEEGRFTCAVGTDDSKDTPLFNTQIYPIQRDCCAENFAEPACFYRCHNN
jgi:hypothetical protein